MTVPAMGSVGAELYEALEPLAGDDEANGYALAHICEAVGRMRQFVADLSEDQEDRPGWANLVDVETSPAVALPWLSQIPGVKLTTGASEDVQRNEIRIRAGQARGRPASTLAKVKAVLSGTKSVRLLERVSSAWTYTVVVHSSEVPPTDIAHVNLLPNPGPQTDLAGWSAAGTIFIVAGGALLWVTTPTPQIGLGAIRVTTNGASSLEGASAALGGTFHSGLTYTYATYLRGNAGGETVEMRFGVGGDTGTTFPIALTTSWVRYAITWTPTADRTSVLVAIRLTTTPAAVFYVNGGVVAPGSTPADYGSGDSAGWVWDGTPNNSSSHSLLTTTVYDAALADKPGGDIMNVVISDDPLIADFTLPIDNLTETIDSFTLDGVT